jgi:hypothetical protein
MDVRGDYTERYYRPPSLASAVGSLDLRSLTKQGRIDAADPGYGLFVHTAGVDIAGGIKLGDSPGSVLRLAQRQGIERELGLVAGSLLSVTLQEILAEISQVHSDPAGALRVKPFRMGRRKGHRINLPGFGRLVSEQWASTGLAFAKTLEVRFADYRRHRAYAETLPGEKRARYLAGLRRWNGFDMRELYGRIGDDLLPAIVPPEYRLDGFAEPRTTVQDTFTDSDTTDLLAHVPTPTDWGAWEQSDGTGGATILSNAVRSGDDNSGPAAFRAALDTPLDSDSMYSEIELISGDDRWAGAATRHAAAAQTYYMAWDSLGNNTWLFAKYVTGSLTENLGGTSGVADTGSLIRLESDSSDLHTVSVDGSPLTGLVDISDSSITGNLLPGWTGNNSSTGDYDNFEAADVAGGGAPNTRRYSMLALGV